MVLQVLIIVHMPGACAHAQCDIDSLTPALYIVEKGIYIYIALNHQATLALWFQSE